MVRAVKIRAPRPPRKPRLRRPGSPEKAVVKACIDYLKLNGAFIWRQNQGGAIFDGRFVRFAHVDGISDIIGVLRCGCFCAVECKAGKNGLTKDQALFLSVIRQQRGFAIEARSFEDVRYALDLHRRVCTKPTTPPTPDIVTGGL